MTKTYRVNVDCADCAVKIERAARGIDGVEKARLNFMTQRMKITAEEGRFESILDEVERVGGRIERGFAVER